MSEIQIHGAPPFVAATEATLATLPSSLSTFRAHASAPLVIVDASDVIPPRTAVPHAASLFVSGALTRASGWLAEWVDAAAWVTLDHGWRYSPGLRRARTLLPSIGTPDYVSVQVFTAPSALDESVTLVSLSTLVALIPNVVIPTTLNEDSWWVWSDSQSGTGGSDTHRTTFSLTTFPTFHLASLTGRVRCVGKRGALTIDLPDRSTSLPARAEVDTEEGFRAIPLEYESPSRAALYSALTVADPISGLDQPHVTCDRSDLFQLLTLATRDPSR